MSTAVARKRKRARIVQVLRPHELDRLRYKLLRKLPSAAWVDCQFVYIAGVDPHGRPMNTAIYAPWACPCPPKADTLRTRMRRCAVCGRPTPAANTAVAPDPRCIRPGRVRICDDCRMSPDDPANDAFGPSPLHTALEVIRYQARIGGDKWTKKI